MQFFFGEDDIIHSNAWTWLLRKIELLEAWTANSQDLSMSQTVSALGYVIDIEKLNMLEFLLDRSSDHEEVLRNRAFIWAIDNAKPRAIEWLMKRGGFDPKNVLPGTNRFSSLAAIQIILYPHTLWRNWDRKKAAREALARHSVDMNKIYPGMGKTPLQQTIKRRDIRIAIWLLGHDTDPCVDVESLPAGAKGRRMPPIMYLAYRANSIPLVRALIQKGVERTYIWKRKQYTLYIDRGVSPAVRVRKGFYQEKPLLDLRD
ncbi:hypothetical protein BJX64DRAFT_272991 [Aspergillus heterothallicus]